MKADDAVWYDENPGKVLSVNDGDALVQWDNGTRDLVRVADLTPMTTFEANTSFSDSREEVVHWSNTPSWIEGMTQFRSDVILWTRSVYGVPGQQVHHSYWADGSYMARWEVTEPRQRGSLADRICAWLAERDGRWHYAAHIARELNVDVASALRVLRVLVAEDVVERTRDRRGDSPLYRYVVEDRTQ